MGARSCFPKPHLPFALTGYPLNETFQGLLESEVACRACQHSSVTEDRFLHLSLDIPPVSRLIAPPIAIADATGAETGGAGPGPVPFRGTRGRGGRVRQVGKRSRSGCEGRARVQVRPFPHPHKALSPARASLGRGGELEGGGEAGAVPAQRLGVERRNRRRRARTRRCSRSAAASLSRLRSCCPPWGARSRSC